MLSGMESHEHGMHGRDSAEPTQLLAHCALANVTCHRIRMHLRPIHESAGAKAVPLYLTMIGLHLGLGLALKFCEWEGVCLRAAAVLAILLRLWLLVRCMRAHPALTLPNCSLLNHPAADFFRCAALVAQIERDGQPTSFADACLCCASARLGCICVAACLAADLSLEASKIPCPCLQVQRDTGLTTLASGSRTSQPCTFDVSIPL